jgi:DNA-binding protein H-NS
MATLQELLAQREALEREIEHTKRAAKADAIAKVRSLMTEFGLTIADIGAKGPVKGSAGKGAKVAAKYQDGAGNTWSGRGLQPKWLKAAIASGKSLSDFAI